jgi:hypothetical protein
MPGTSNNSSVKVPSNHPSVEASSNGTVVETPLINPIPSFVLRTGADELTASLALNPLKEDIAGIILKWACSKIGQR